MRRRDGSRRAEAELAHRGAVRSRAARQPRPAVDRGRPRRSCRRARRLAAEPDSLGVPAGDGRGRVRHRLLHACGHVARRDGLGGAQDREGARGDPRDRPLDPPNRCGARADHGHRDPHRATSRSCSAGSGAARRRGDDRRRPGASRRHGARGAHRVRADPRGRPERSLGCAAPARGSNRPARTRRSCERVAKDVAGRLEGTPSLVDFYDGIEAEVPIHDYRLNGEAAVRAGVDAAQVADNVGVALRGTVVGTVPRFDRLVPVRVRFPDAVRFDPERLDAAPLAPDGAAVPLSRFAHAVSADRRAACSAARTWPRRSPRPATSRERSGRPHRARCAAVSPALDVPGRLSRRDRRARREPGRGLQAARRRSLCSASSSSSPSWSAQFRSARAALLVLLTIPPAIAGGLLALAVNPHARSTYRPSWGSCSWSAWS